MQDMEKDKVLVRLVDDDPAVRDAAAFMLACKGWKTVAYESAKAFLVNDRPSVPGCLVLDIRMPGMSGLELQTEMKRRGYSLPVIFLTGHGSVDTAVSTLRRGAFDFLQKPVDNARLLESIARACDLSLVRSRGELAGDEADRVIAEMSARELEILGLIREGLANRVISERLGIAERTVQGHRNNIYHKLRVHNEQGLLECLERARAAREA